MIKRYVKQDTSNEKTTRIKNKVDTGTQTPKRLNILKSILIKFKQNIRVKSNIFFFLLGLITSNQFFSVYFEDLSKNNEFNLGIRDHKLAVVVPYRERFEELLVFVPHMSKFLASKSINFKIFVINQVDSFRFNRASLINIGFLTAMKECDYMVMHDVDLLPLTEKLDYSYPLNGPFHVSSSGLHPEYNYSTFIGGILIIKKEDFIKTNGMSNRYWGWGKEDDDFYNRLIKANITIHRPNVKEFESGSNFTFLNNHDSEKRKRDKKRFLKQKKESLRFDQTGLESIMYKIQSINQILIDKYPCTIVNVELFCDRYDTHWCNMDYQFL
ncbi:unnamed protein product [Brachionus calyciflorus]|uniref:Beta-1,4-galactosyltransferase n=1 Tax=Brachionus calyciflorus TaxID=104777 RepID=A0A813QFM2_9BILA|nr:unnamed protein product [Brachionus calyciflorus]